MPHQDQFSWSFAIRAHARRGHGKEALQLVQQLRMEGNIADKFIYASIISACASLGSLAEGKRMHALLVGFGLGCNVVLCNALISMYGNCGGLVGAESVFVEMVHRDVVSWNAMIDACINQGPAVYHGDPDFLNNMLNHGILPDKVTFVSMCSVCACQESFSQGKQMHARVIGTEMSLDNVFRNALLNMYGKHGSLKNACTVFYQSCERDIISWTALISSYTQTGKSIKGFQFLTLMQCEGVLANRVAFITILSASAGRATSQEARWLHTQLLSCNLQLDLVVGNALINLYGKCGSLDEGIDVLQKMQERDVFSWNGMISGQVQHNHRAEALKLCSLMQIDGVMPDIVTFVSIVSSCTDQDALSEGLRIHASIVAADHESNVILATTLIHMYGKCGSVERARRVFDRMPVRNTASWTTMIAIYAQHGHGEKALNVYSQMCGEKIMPDKFTYVSVLSAYASLAALTDGRILHAYILDTSFEADVAMTNALINLYAKCGKLEDARRMFDMTCTRDTVSWSTMITAYAQCGKGKDALRLYKTMLAGGHTPDSITSVSILSACSHMGMIEEGCGYFYSMEKDHGIKPDIDHYNCVIDLLCRAGRLSEAEGLIKEMPSEPNRISWLTLLGACKGQTDTERGELAAKRAFNLGPEDPSPYVTLANIYAAARRQNAALKQMNNRSGQPCIACNLAGPICTQNFDRMRH